MEKIFVENSSTRKQKYAIHSTAKLCYADPFEQLSEEEGVQLALAI
jgi:hypothetical protein